ncbi:hypothetical protein F1188_06130 [Roseospira marina]|uniref:HPt domain-containing protein n=1 Tax=Roseospira marina TaxID=140057 RepID=A0A5M6IDX3_9PROT|nr:Hpt domain-containing protein [Roseospira marina]KAA5606443.1 hypothetical protein F1188_06130 [Roseospira marina]MBB4314142.1 chemotaxis protein histidine kinase CheA [Roseospira marina]MBB5087303.1 chemotaxis protein histidine kinase CheA [Roseospira marina]
MDDDDDLLAEFQREFADRLDQDGAAIAMLRHSLGGAPDPAAPAWVALASIAHRLTGRGQTLGHETISTVARRVETLANGTAPEGLADAATLDPAVQTLLNAMAAVSAEIRGA